MSTNHQPPTPRRTSASHRFGALLTAAACLAVLVLAGVLRADPSGHGTHEQLGLPPCGWAVATDTPCATCGMTTSYSALVAGDPVASFQAQPMGTLLALATAAVFWIALHTVVTGSRATEFAMRALQPRFLWTVAAIWAASWAYKIATWGGA